MDPQSPCKCIQRDKDSNWTLAAQGKDGQIKNTEEDKEQQRKP